MHHKPPPAPAAAAAAAPQTWAAARRANARGRDFTVNALLWDPLGSNLLYDYTGALPDLRSRMLRAVGGAAASFAADPPRVLRGVRVAARAGEAAGPRARRVRGAGVPWGDAHASCSCPSGTNPARRRPRAVTPCRPGPGARD